MSFYFIIYFELSNFKRSTFYFLILFQSIFNHKVELNKYNSFLNVNFLVRLIDEFYIFIIF